ncbi:DNA replication protein [Psychrobacillus sp. MER TA 17]|nr:DNA replication protein [Psychrobacillus sp. MER TA 17]
MTNESKCILAPSCAFAGDADKCHDRCPAYIQMHSASGRHTLAGLPSEYALIDIASAPPRADQASAYTFIDDYAATFARQFDDKPAIKSAYLYSAEPGTGKTTTAAGLINAWLRAHYVGAARLGRQPLRKPAEFFDLNEYQTAYNLAAMTNDDVKLQALSKRLNDAARVPFLALDDVGIRSATEAFRGLVHAVINARLASGLPTVYTSNIEMADLANVYDERLADRIRDKCKEVPFVGKSKRGLRR